MSFVIDSSPKVQPISERNAKTRAVKATSSHDISSTEARGDSSTCRDFTKAGIPIEPRTIFLKRGCSSPHKANKATSQERLSFLKLFSSASLGGMAELKNIFNY